MRLLPTLLGALGVALWATETALITFTTGIPPLQTVGMAFAVAALLSPAVWLFTGDDPRAAFRQPLRVWLVTVGSLVGYHACIYYATQKAPPAAAALLQGTTPLIIVLGSALLPGERLRWWHLAGAGLGLAGILLLIGSAEHDAVQASDPVFYLSIVGVAAALWGLYSIVSRGFGDVPTSALGVFYAGSAVVSLLLHAGFETWVTPTRTEWLAVAALGLLPMGLALYLWDHGLKRGDIQALGAISYVEPFIGAALVAMIGQGRLDAALAAAGVLVVGGAVIASKGLLRPDEPTLGGFVGHARPDAAGEAEGRLEGELLEFSIRVLRHLDEAARADAGGRTARDARAINRLVARTVAAWRLLEAARRPSG